MSNAARESYRPLIVLLGIILLAAALLEGARGVPFMQSFMGLFFLLFAMFKLFDLQGFANGFQMYDLLGKRWRLYALAYPWIELLLGVSYLGGFFLLQANLVTLILMLVSAVGVIRSVRAGMNLRCACLGTVLNVPLSTVSIIENLGMAAMAGLMLLAMA